MIISGIDETGKGAVFGDMIVALATSKYSLEETNSLLLRLGVKDSKLLSRIKRKEIIKVLDRDPNIKIEIISIPSSTIDRYVFSQKLNELLFEKNVELINKLPESQSICYIDAFITPLSLETRLSSLAKNNLIPPTTFIIEHKADLKYPIVGLASIYAKEYREDLLDATGLRESIGSGYPSDEKVKNYIRNNFKSYCNKTLKSIRYSWKLKL